MDYKSARLISASGLLNKNKGIMVVGTGGSVSVRLRGLSGGNWVTSTTTIQSTTSCPVTIVPIQVYGVTLSAGDVYELN